MKRNDDVRAALREAAEIVEASAGGLPARDEAQRLAIARRLRGLARRVSGVKVDSSGHDCPYWWNYLGDSRCRYTRQFCEPGVDPCPLARGPIVVRVDR